MRLMLFLLLASLAGMCCLEASCAGPSASSPDAAAADSTAAKAAEKMAMPADADSAKVAFRDLHWYTEKDVFYVVGIVDNLALEWHRIWLRLDVQDAAGQALRINGAPNAVVPTFSDAVPPRGATAFFHAIPLKHLSGAPANCRLSGAGAILMPPGPIMVASDVGGVRALRPDPNDPTNIVEQVYQAQAVIENPLDVTAYHPRYILLVYGQDKLLHFAQVVNPELPDTPVRQERQGPIAPREKRQVLCPIFYDMLPQALRDTLIERVDVQIFEARQ